MDIRLFIMNRILLAAVISCSFLILSSLLYRSSRITSVSELEPSFVFVAPVPTLKLKRNSQLRNIMLSSQIDFLQYRNMCLVACRSSLAEESPSESSIHCRADTLTPRWLDYIHNCELDSRKCEIQAMGCRGWILA